MSNKPRSKDEIAADMLRQQEIARKRAIVTDSLYPAVVEASESVEDAKMMMSAVSSMIMEAVMERMKGMYMSEIRSEIMSKLGDDVKKRGEIEEMLSVMDGENLFTSRELIETVTRTVNQMVYEDMAKRPLSEMKPDWERYLN